MCMNVLFTHTHTPHMCAQYSQRSEEGIKSPGSEITDVHESLCEYWELNPDPMQEQKMLLTAKSSTQFQ